MNIGMYLDGPKENTECKHFLWARATPVEIALFRIVTGDKGEGEGKEEGGVEREGGSEWQPPFLT